MSRKISVLLALVLFAAGLFVGNSSWLLSEPGASPLWLAHRGIAQTFPLDGVAADTCTAERIDPPRHGYLENTLPSMRAAFAAGADMLEFDVQVTADDQLVVFHDALLECRTDGAGPVREHTLAELRALDVGYGYTADGGVTFPLRGTGVGLMPTVAGVVAAFPGRELLLDVKNDAAAEGEPLAAYLATLPAERLKTIAAYGGDTPIGILRDRLPQLRAASKETMKNCLISYVVSGAIGHVPTSCHHTELHLPARYGRFLWGWPNLFVERMRAVDTRVVLVAGDGSWSEGFDTADSLDGVPEGWPGWIWTNRVDAVRVSRRGSRRSSGSARGSATGGGGVRRASRGGRPGRSASRAARSAARPGHRPG